MSNVVIGAINPYTQAYATQGQTIFSTNWTANAASDVVVYYTPVGTPPDDATQILAYPADYSVAFIGGSLQVQVTLVTPAVNTGDIVTITRQTPADYLNLYSNTNFTPSMLNNDFGILTLIEQQNQLVNQLIAPRYNYSATIVDVVDTILPILLANQTWAKNPGNTAIVGYTLPPVSSGIAPADATYILQTANASLPNSQALSALGANAILAWNNGTEEITATKILGTDDQITVVNGDGNGTIGLSIPANPIMPGVGGMGIPIGTTAQRVTQVSNISLRYNTDVQDLEYFNGSAWIQVSQQDLSGLPIVLETESAEIPNGFVLTAGSGVTLTPSPGELLISSTGMGGTVTSFAFTNGDGFTGVVSNPTTTPTLSLTGAFLPLAGGTMSGDISLGNAHRVTNALDPSAAQDYATKNYVDQTALNGTSVYAATAATLGTVTQSGAGVGATLTNAGAQAAFVADSATVPVGQNVLVKNTATGMTAANEGIYTLTNAGSPSTNWVLTRATDYDTTTEINNTGLILIQNGSTLAGQAWYNTATIVTVDTTAFNYAQFGGVSGFSSINVQVITATGTFTPTTGAVEYEVFGVGGGGGAGGVPLCANGGAGSSGSGAGYVFKKFNATEMGASAAVVVGAKGTGGASGSNNGTAGGDSTFSPAGTGATLTASGGGKGYGGNNAAGPAFVATQPDAPGTGTNGDLNIAGSYGTIGQSLGNSVIVPIGGASHLCEPAQTSVAGSGPLNGSNATNYGGAGSGGVSITSSAAASGGDGFDGVWFVIEYIG